MSEERTQCLHISKSAENKTNPEIKKVHQAHFAGAIESSAVAGHKGA